MRQMKIVKGEQALKELMKRMRPTSDIVFCETTGHCDDIYITLHYYRDHKQPDEGYRLFYVLSLQHPNGWVQGHDDAERIAYLAVTGTMKDLENGEWREKNLRECYPDLDRRIKQLTW